MLRTTTWLVLGGLLALARPAEAQGVPATRVFEAGVTVGRLPVYEGGSHVGAYTARARSAHLGFALDPLTRLRLFVGRAQGSEENLYRFPDFSWYGLDVDYAFVSLADDRLQVLARAGIAALRTGQGSGKLWGCSPEAVVAGCLDETPAPVRFRAGTTVHPLVGGGVRAVLGGRLLVEVGLGRLLRDARPDELLAGGIGFLW